MSAANTHRHACHACDCREAEQRQIITDLIDVATGAVPHMYSGKCPDEDRTGLRRDPECPACQAILRAEAWTGPLPLTDPVPPVAVPEVGSRLTFESSKGGNLTGFVAAIAGDQARVMDVLESLDARNWRWSEWIDWTKATRP